MESEGTPGKPFKRKCQRTRREAKQEKARESKNKNAIEIYISIGRATL